MTTPIMEATEARRRLDRIRISLEGIQDEVLALWRGQGWLALGYPTWAEMNAAELPFRLALPRDERPALVGSLKSEGMSGPAIADALGIDERTVRRDLTSANAEVAPTVGLDGRTYKPREPRETVIDRETGEVLPEIIDPFAGWSEDEHLIRKQLEAGTIAVISLRSHHTNVLHWAEAKGLLVRIDRRSEWGNPFEIPDDGNRDVVIAKYAEHYLPHKPALQERVKDLRGKALACWCAPERCHGDILKAEAER